MVRKLSILAVLALSLPLIAEEREVATEDTQHVVIETAANQRSFFQPKTVEDVNALATLEIGLEASLTQEISN